MQSSVGKEAKQQQEKQIEEILSKLTLEEKISMIHGSGLFRTAEVPRLGIPCLHMSDGPMGIRKQFPDDSWRALGYSDDFVSYLPSNSALAATWNPELAATNGRILGDEARGRGKDVILAPGINIKRDPLCGRNFEYMSEDPYLIETLVVPFIQGVQENDVAACVKHFAVNGQETNRLWVDTLVDERTLQEIYYPGFRAAVQEAGCYSLMNAYNKVNGISCSEHGELLDTVLREEWEYDGCVISDWGSVHRTVESAAVSLDIEMSVKNNFEQYYFAAPLLEAVKNGLVKEETIDKKVRNVLRLMFRLKMLGPDSKDRYSGTYSTPAHQQGTRRVAQEAIVLLKNEENLLPITQERLNPLPFIPVQQDTGVQVWAAPRRRKIALIGHNAEHNHGGGGGSAEVRALYEISPLLGLKKALGANVEVSYAQGYYIPGEKDVNEVNWQAASLERQVMGEEADNPQQSALRAKIKEERAQLRREACELAAAADEVIFIGGLNHDYDVEGRDRADMRLPYGQDELIEALLDINPNTIVVMVAGSPVEMPWRDRVKALLWCYYSGMETGNALADILLGRVNPSGKLPESFPARYEDTVTAQNGQFGREERIALEEGIFVGYRYYEKKQVKPAYAFGYGLSYTTFALEGMEAEVLCATGMPQILGDDTKKQLAVKVTLHIINTGSRPGAEVVQCYVADCECKAERPVKELKAYSKVYLQPREQRDITFTLPLQAFAFYDVERKAFVVEPGRFLLLAGNSSDCCNLQTEITL